MAAGPAPDQPRQFWIRNDKGKMWGPLTFSTIELLIDNGAIPGKLQASRNGVDFYYPGRLPEMRDAVPKELWGDSTDPIPDDAPSGPIGRQGTGPRQPPTVGAPGKGPPVVGPRGGPPVVGKPGSSPSSAAIPKPSAVSSPSSAASPKPGAASSPSSASIPKPAPPKPTVPDGAGVPASGSLKDFPPFRIYYLAATTNQTGKLTMNGVEASYEVFFKKGAPEAVRSSLDEEDLGSWLVEKKVLSSDKLGDARKMAGNFGGEILNALFGLQLLSPGDAFKHIGEHAQSLLRKAFTMDAGTFSFDASAPVPSSAMPLGDRWKIICDMVRDISTADLKKRLGSRMSAPVMKSGGRVEISQLKLTAQEARAAVYFDGVRSLDQLIEAMPNDAETLVRTAFLLYRFEACSFAGGEDPEPEVDDHPTPKPDSDQPPPEVEAAAAAKAAEEAPLELDLGAEAVEEKRAEEPPLELDLGTEAVEAKPAKPAARPEPPKGAPPKIEPKAAPPKIEPAKGAPPVVGPAKGAPPTVGPAKPGAAAPGKPPVVGPAARPAVNPGKPPVVGPAGKPAVNPGKPPVVPTVGKPAAKPAAPAAPKPAAPVAAPAAGSGPANPGNDSKALTAYFEGLKGKNHFEVLGVPETANTGEVKKAYFQFAKWFHPDTAQGAAPEVGKLKADIFARINEANSVLADDKSRANYLEEMKAGAEKLDAAKIFASEETFQKGCIHVKARKYPEAVKLFDEAVALYDKEGEYFIWRGWAKFLAAADKKAAKDASLKEIDKGCEMSPRCAMGPYFKGQIHKLLGDPATAQKLFRETLEKDPNHLEAQREVRQR